MPTILPDEPHMKEILSEIQDAMRNELQRLAAQQVYIRHEAMLSEAKRDAGLLRSWIQEQLEPLDAVDKEPFRLLDVVEEADEWTNARRYNLVVILEPVPSLEGREFIAEAYARKINIAPPECAHKILEDISAAFLFWHRTRENPLADTEARRFIEQCVLEGKHRQFSERAIDIRWNALEACHYIMAEVSID